MLGDTALAGLAGAVVLLAEARARTHMTTSRMLGDTALAGLAGAVVLLAEARARTHDHKQDAGGHGAGRAGRRGAAGRSKSTAEARRKARILWIIYERFVRTSK